MDINALLVKLIAFLLFSSGLFVLSTLLNFFEFIDLSVGSLFRLLEIVLQLFDGLVFFTKYFFLLGNVLLLLRLVLVGREFKFGEALVTELLLILEGVIFFLLLFECLLKRLDPSFHLELLFHDVLLVALLFTLLLV